MTPFFVARYIICSAAVLRRRMAEAEANTELIECPRRITVDFNSA